jgi:hypothetical protein
MSHDDKKQGIAQSQDGLDQGNKKPLDENERIFALLRLWMETDHHLNFCA